MALTQSIEDNYARFLLAVQPFVEERCIPRKLCDIVGLDANVEIDTRTKGKPKEAVSSTSELPVLTIFRLVNNMQQSVHYIYHPARSCPILLPGQKLTKVREDLKKLFKLSQAMRLAFEEQQGIVPEAIIVRALVVEGLSVHSETRELTATFREGDFVEAFKVRLNFQLHPWNTRL